ncbi:MAG: SAM-dependent chlorinase/fluorinase [Candidatus Hydrogenedentes bacterium]|nr:SAM-dependent chlorinase/fluorinase [Candidatus Hydrogenedentota bacterium]
MYTSTRSAAVLCLALLGIAAMPAYAEDVLRPSGHVILLTDYGTDSVYVGIIKGAVYSKFPEAKVDEITNGIPPFDITTGAYLLAEAAGEYPKGTVFCCIVDPGVGTERKAIAVETNAGYFFVGPDNGILTLVAEKFGVKSVRECTNTALWRSGVTSTVFHGRDIFGPVSASLAKGIPLVDVGEKLESITKLELEHSRVEGDTAHGSVMRADPYGNLVTTITSVDFENLGIKEDDKLEVTIGDATYTAPLAKTYAMVPEGERLVVVQSSGFIECAINKGSLADTIKQGAKAPVAIKKAP